LFWLLFVLKRRISERKWTWKNKGGKDVGDKMKERKGL
jgi:hypothetical protein